MPEKEMTAKQKKYRSQLIGFLSVNLSFLLGAALLMPYRRLADGYMNKVLFCFWNRILHIYCPTCGMTRALDSILHLRFIDAATENPCVLAVVLLTVYFDIRALIALIRHEETVFKVRWWQFWTVMSLFLVFAAVRNILLVYVGYDPLGDLYKYWH